MTTIFFASTKQNILFILFVAFLSVLIACLLAIIIIVCWCLLKTFCTQRQLWGNMFAAVTLLAVWLAVWWNCSESIKLKIDDGENEWPYLHYARFTPHTNAIVLVYNYDIYYCQGARSQFVHRITRDAIPGVIFNGIPDWLYEGKSIAAVRLG